MKKAFTLVELLVVIVIIAILSTLVLTGVGAARRYADKVTATTEAKNLQQAFQMYYEEYKRWPTVGTGPKDQDPEKYQVSIKDHIAQILTGDNDSYDNNNKRIAFMKFQKIDSAGNPVNPWTKTATGADNDYYYAKFDINFDNIINTSASEPPNTSVRRSVIVWTSHKDGSKLIDLVTSWSQ